MRACPLTGIVVVVYETLNVPDPSVGLFAVVIPSLTVTAHRPGVSGDAAVAVIVVAPPPLAAVASVAKVLSGPPLLHVPAVALSSWLK
ncbi:MAG TPA: hypothetical protein VFE70_00660, partial [Candidatus Elarobacter sp.]|nr:hypothetical protein [Candidatus Elarobacter sp.]